MRAPSVLAAIAAFVLTDACAHSQAQTQSLQQTIEALERQSWVAWQHHDGALYQHFLSEDHVEVHRSGLSNKNADCALCRQRRVRGRELRARRHDLHTVQRGLFSPHLSRRAGYDVRNLARAEPGSGDFRLCVSRWPLAELHIRTNANSGRALARRQEPGAAACWVENDNACT